MLKTILCCVSVGILMGGVVPAHAEGLLRERIREAMQTRMAEKMGEKRGGKLADSSSSDVKAPMTKAGDYTFEIKQGDLTRKYLVHVPPNYHPQNPTPLLVAFHGGGGSMEHMAKDELYGLITKSNKEGFIVAFPNGYSKFAKGIFATWNAGNCCGDARDKKIDDVEFIRAMVANIAGQMNIDRNRIFATGMSNGGMISYVMACELPDIFKAIAAVAGTDNTVTCSHKQPISILHIHAKNDDHVLFNGGAGEGAFKDESKVTQFTSVPESINRWVDYNQCNPTPQRVLTVNGAYCDLYSGCKDDKQVELCVTDTGGHSWPGGYKPRGEGTSKAIFANDVMWDFFKNQR